MPKPLSDRQLACSPKISNTFASLLGFEAAFILILKETTFHNLQIFLETNLLLMFVFLLFRLKFSPTDFLFLVVTSLIALLSFFTLDIEESIICSKNMLLAASSYLVFKQCRLSAVPIVVFAIVCIALVTLQLFVTKRFPFEIQNYLTGSAWLMDSRPLGLFLSEQTSSAFLAIVFSGFVLSKKTWALGLFILLQSKVSTPIIMLVGHKIVGISKKLRYVCNNYIFAPILLITVASSIIWIFPDWVLMALGVLGQDSVSSAGFIVRQMSSFEYLYHFFRFLPGDILSLESTVGVPEVGIYKYFMTYGVVFSLMLLLVLMKSLNVFRVVILLSLTHFTIIHLPFFLYVLHYFQSKSEDTKRF